MALPREYVVQKFYQYCGIPKFNKVSNTYSGSCAICREDSSWLKKRRCYYVVEKDYICCHNCGWSSKPMRWIQEVSGLTRDEVLKESSNYDILPIDILNNKSVYKPIVSRLPSDSINLFDNNQVSYYKANKVIGDILSVIKERRLDTAINKPNTLWVSLTDYIHKNRLIIPFYDINNEIIFYQSRQIYIEPNKNLPKYLSKQNGEKSLFNINKISSDIDYIFVFEGPINACFCKNGTAVAGIQEDSDTTFTSLQLDQLQDFKFHKIIWVLDSQWIDRASYKKTQRLIDIGENVFIWPENIGKQYKDTNDLCKDKELDSIDIDYIIKNSYNGLKAKIQLANIKY